MGTQYLFRQSLRCFLDDADLLLGQAVEFVNDPFDLFIGRDDLALNQVPVMSWKYRGRKTYLLPSSCVLVTVSSGLIRLSV